MYLAVEGYKSISDRQGVAVDGLTVLSGSNSSGKSSFMQPFLILKQTLESHYDSKVLTLEGENVKLTDSSQLISKVPGKKKPNFSVYHGSNDTEVSVVYKYSSNHGFQVHSVTSNAKEFPNGLHFKYGMKENVIEEQIPDEDYKDFKNFFSEQGEVLKWKVLREKCFLKAVLAQEQDHHIFGMNVDPARGLERFVKRLIHVPGLRGNPERNYRVAFSEQHFPGSFEKYVAGIVDHWCNGKTKRDRKNYEQLKSDLYFLGLAGSIGAEKINDTRIEIKVSRYNSCLAGEDSVNIADVGFGVSQTLPVLVALIAASKGQVVYIEQPELHLHPKAQHDLSYIISRAVSRGVYVIIETHSSILIRGIQTLVAKGHLGEEKVSLNWFSQRPKDGQTEVVSAKLDEYGAFGDWPEDFDETSLKAESEYLDAVELAIHERN